MKIPFFFVLTRNRIIAGVVILLVLIMVLSRGGKEADEKAMESATPAPGTGAPAAGGTAKTPAVSPGKTPLPVELSVANMISLVNHSRGLKGVPALRLHTALNAAAQAHANDMAARAYFSHNSPEGDTLQTRLATVGYNHSATAENLGLGKTAIVVYENWSNSPEHLANMVDRRFTDIGVGFAGGLYQGVSATYVVVVFGAR